MTNEELIDILTKYKKDSPINFCLFSNLTLRRCDVKDSNVMIKQSPHTGSINIMINLEKYWEDDILNCIHKNMNGFNRL